MGQPTGMIQKLVILSLSTTFGWALLYTVAPAPEKDSSAKPHPPGAGQIEVLSETPDYRLIRHPLGETKTPLLPRRIACISMTHADNLAALGVRPVLVMALTWKNGGPFPCEQVFDGLPILHRRGPLNLELVLAAKPDLILASRDSDGKLYRQLERIAPTVFLPSQEGDPDARENSLLDIGRVLGMQQQAQCRLAEYRKRLQRATSLMNAAVGQPILLLRFSESTGMALARSTTPGLLLFDRLGLTADPAMSATRSPDGWWRILSPECLAMLHAEHVFVVFHPGSETYLHDLAQSPLWQNIAAVRRGQVYRVTSNRWLGEGGILQNEAILDDAVAAMASKRR